MSLLLVNLFQKSYNDCYEIINNPDNLANRIFQASIPYFRIFHFLPCSMLILQGRVSVLALQKTYMGIKSTTKSYHEKGLTKELGMSAARTVVSVSIDVVGLVNYRFGAFYALASQSYDALYVGIDKFKNKNYRQAGIEFYKAMTHGLLAASLLHPAGLELHIASKAFQIILNLGFSYREFRNGRRIETISNLGLACIVVYQLRPKIEELNQKWKKQSVHISNIEISSKIDEEGKKIIRRAAIDVGSGGTKVLIADVDGETNEIVNVIVDKSFSVAYQASLEKSANGTFDETIQEQGLRTFNEIRDLLNLHQVKSINAIATEAFRKAGNGAEFAKQVNDATGIPLKVISQEQEGIIAYHSALAMNKSDPDKTIVWDIGTGSFQITTKGETGEYRVFTGGLGSVPFKNHVIQNIQGKNPGEISTPNPISPEDYRQAGRFARSLARQATRDVKAMIKAADAMIVGIGRLFYNSVRPLVSESDTITRKGLRNYIQGALEKTDQELNDPYAASNLTNCIQVLEVMKALHIHEICAVNTTTTKGLIIGTNESFSDWK